MVIHFLAAIGCVVIAGVFFAFSTFVMSALAQLQAREGIAAMQLINLTAINPLFMGALFGTGIACLFLVGSLLHKWQQPGMIYLLLGSLLYLIGAVGVTIVFNVPLNDALATVKPDSPEGANLWSTYLTNWTRWNHIRTVTSLAAAILLSIALGARSTP
jgi:uncharacterized membrane protein